MIESTKVLQGDIVAIERTLKAVQRARKAGDMRKVNSLLGESADMLNQIQGDLADTRNEIAAIGKRTAKAVGRWDSIQREVEREGGRRSPLGRQNWEVASLRGRGGRMISNG